MSSMFFLLTSILIRAIGYIYPVRKPYYIITMKKNNPIAKQLGNPKYRSRVVPKKRGVDETYDWVTEWQEEQDGTTTEDSGRDKDIQSTDDS